jgi:hypothetical protein
LIRRSLRLPKIFLRRPVIMGYAAANRPEKAKRRF